MMKVCPDIGPKQRLARTIQIIMDPGTVSLSIGINPVSNATDALKVFKDLFIVLLSSYESPGSLILSLLIPVTTCVGSIVGPQVIVPMKDNFDGEGGTAS